jgi:hypothetical protein
MRKSRRPVLGEDETNGSAQQHLKENISEFDYGAKPRNAWGAEITDINHFSHFPPTGFQVKQNEYWMGNEALIIIY